MNCCRTCRYWAVYAGPLGYGACINVEVQLRVNIGSIEGFKTSQDFGCPFHEEGKEDPSVYSSDVQKRLLQGFVSERKQIQ